MICMICMICLMLSGGTPTICHYLQQQHMFHELDLYYTDPAQHITTAGSDADDLLDRYPSIRWANPLGLEGIP